jgi:NADPH2:quinone reductase
MLTHAIRIHETGGPEVLRWEEIDLGRPGPGEVRLRQTAVGLNYIDTYHRSGLYPLELPAVLGREAAGVVEEVGAGVAELRPGDRVAYALHPGAYAEARLMPAARLVRLPDGIDERTAAAAMLKGLTAHYLLRRTHRVEPGETILLHAAAGGVGLIACQWAKRLGATVIGTVGSPEKAAIARAHGCDHTVLYDREDVVARVRELTGGRGVGVVYDSVGRATLEASLDCLAPCGLLVSFGQSSGPVPPLNLGLLAQKGSLFVTRPTLATFIAEREDLLAASAELFDAIREGGLRVEIGQTYPLRDASRAHRDLEARRTRGSTLLVP